MIMIKMIKTRIPIAMGTTPPRMPFASSLFAPVPCVLWSKQKAEAPILTQDPVDLLLGHVLVRILSAHPPLADALGAGHGIIPIRVSPLGKWAGKETRKHVRSAEQVGDSWLA